MFKRKKRVGTKTKHDEQFVYLVVTNALVAPGGGITFRVLADERSVDEARRDATRFPDPKSAFFTATKVSVDTIRPWYRGE